MDRARIRELHYITDIANVASILDLGILSHRLAERIAHISVADEQVQAIRAAKRIWTGRSYRWLHEYANLYVHARNAMLYRLLKQGTGELTVLAVDPRVLDVEGVLVSDRNAAGPARFELVPEGLLHLDEEAVFAASWTASDDAKQRRCAEVLVPKGIDPAMVRRAYVPDVSAARQLLSSLTARRLPIEVRPPLFFNLRRTP
jgi:ssDNA thymidine ADP-ribosyltransferase, DarT